MKEFTTRYLREPFDSTPLFHAEHYQLPDVRGHFGPYGGVFVSETLIHALDELNEAYARLKEDAVFLAEFRRELKHFVGRPSPIYHAERWSNMLGGGQIYFKREDLNHTGAHKINNVIGQALLAKRMGKPRFRSRMRGLHGQRGREAPSAERLPDEIAGRDRGAGRIRFEDVEGCVE
ncbi:MAG: trpB [Burkholderiaceae bacterium]|nr:trpB [Burkholderiaceae bacterium]